MAAQLNVQFTDASAAGDPSQGLVRFAVATAFSDWTRHFDYTSGVFTINVSFRAATQPADVSLSIQDFTKVGSIPFSTVVEPSFGLSFAARAASSTTVLTSTLYVNPANFVGSFPSRSNIVAPVERELGHALGIAQLRLGNVVRGPVLQTRQTVYEGGVRFVQLPPNAVATFNGPNAEAVYRGPVPVDNGRTNVTTVGGGAAVDTTTQGASEVQPLDVALLRDAGLPALTDQELLEHSIARMYFVAFGRAADSAGLMLQLRATHDQSLVRGTGSFYGVASSLLSSAEFTARYGTLSNADFIRTVYQNALGRQPDTATLNAYLASFATPPTTRMTGPGATRESILSGLADGDEARGRLSANPNVTYAATAEGQVARLYDTAFGRDADPGGFNGFVSYIVNGATLQEAALSFLGSTEFAARYGGAPSGQALVDALYQNTLHRAPDAAGEALYVQALASGQLSPAALLAAFSDSQEHIILIAQRTDARDAAGFNLDLSPHLGIIPTISGPTA